MSSYEGLVAAALSAASVRSAISYSWFGQCIQVMSRGDGLRLSADEVRRHVVHYLQMQLYTDFYCTGMPVSVRRSDGSWTSSQFTPFVQELSRANCGQGSPEPNWVVREIDDQHAAVERDGLTLWVRPQDVVAGSGGAPACGSTVRVRLPKELLRFSLGYYMALGDEALDPSRTETVVRFYWNLRAEAAHRLVQSVTSGCNEARVAFRLKVLNDPRNYARCDAGVLYVDRRDYERVADVIEAIHRRLADDLDSTTPAFTKQLAHGLGLAEEPRDRRSFGMHRCGLLAEAIVRAHDRGATSAADRLAVVAECFGEAGLSIDAPFLNPQSVDRYTLGELAR